MKKHALVSSLRYGQHIAALRSIGFVGTWLGLRRIECRARRFAEAMCNIPLTEEQIRTYEESILHAVKVQFGGVLPVGFILNNDPRGYALKLDPEKCMLPEGIHTGWGGYGLLAPDPEE